MDAAAEFKDDSPKITKKKKESKGEFARKLREAKASLPNSNALQVTNFDAAPDEQPPASPSNSSKAAKVKHAVKKQEQPPASPSNSSKAAEQAAKNAKSSRTPSPHGKRHKKSRTPSPKARRPLVEDPMRAEQACRFLVNARDKCVEACDYNKACEMNARLEDLKKQLSVKGNNDMLTQQGSMQHAMMFRHVQELQDLKKDWEVRLSNFAEWEKTQWEECRSRHQSEFQDHLVEMQQDQVKLHCGKEVVNMRCKMEYLAGLRRYAEAAMMQYNANDLEMYELEILQGKQEDQKARGGKGPFIQRQNAELGGLETRIAAKRGDLERNRRNDLDQLKYHQTAERTKMCNAHIVQQQVADNRRPSSASTLIRQPLSSSSHPTIAQEAKKALALPKEVWSPSGNLCLFSSPSKLPGHSNTRPGSAPAGRTSSDARPGSAPSVGRTSRPGSANRIAPSSASTSRPGSANRIVPRRSAVDVARPRSASKAGNLGLNRCSAEVGRSRVELLQRTSNPCEIVSMKRLAMDRLAHCGVPPL